MNERNLTTLYIPLEKNLEIARTSRDTGKTPLINYIIVNNNNIKENYIIGNNNKNLREETGITRMR